MCIRDRETTVLRIGVYLVDVLDEAHGYTFIADTYSGSDGNPVSYTHLDVYKRQEMSCFF